MTETDQKTILSQYLERITGYDEILESDGSIKPSWAKLFHSLEGIGLDELQLRKQELDKLLRDNGVSYNVYDEPNGLNRPWQIDPLPFIIEEADWQIISEGLAQRATALDLLCKDLYGAQKILKDKVIPAELVYSHSGYLRPCTDLKISGDKHLIIHAADMARGPGGHMWVLNDWTQAPSGMGYALENRNAMSKILPELFTNIGVGSMNNYFSYGQQGLLETLPRYKDEPFVVFLSPGPSNETYFEHAYLSTFLGVTLAQGADLIARDGYIWLKSINGLQKVDVILRRVDDHFMDPLELREDSHLGVTGLLEVMRRGNVSVINPPGSSILENSGLKAFMQNICRYYLNEDLKLPQIATWWCGQEKERRYVLDNLERLIIKKTDRKENFKRIHARSLSAKEIAQLRAKIEAEPYKYVGQEEVSFSTAPAYTENGIEPRLCALRCYTVANSQGYHVMQGGFTRSSPQEGKLSYSNQQGGVAKDTWIVNSSGQENYPAFQSFQAPSSKLALPSRTGENLFWAGRYCERSMGTSRFINLTILKLNQQRNTSPETDIPVMDCFLESLSLLTGVRYIVDEENPESAAPEAWEQITTLCLSRNKPGCLPYNLGAFLGSARAVRDRWSIETWNNIHHIEELCMTLSNFEKLNVRAIQNTVGRIYNGLVTYYGMLYETMSRQNGWIIFEMGKTLERSLALISLIRSMFGKKREEEVENQLFEAILFYNHSLNSYRMEYRSRYHIETVLDMLLLDSRLPNSLFYQLGRIEKRIDDLPRPDREGRLNNLQKLIVKATSLVKLIDAASLSTYHPETLEREELDTTLHEIADCLIHISSAMNTLYFKHTEEPHTFMEIMKDEYTS